MRSPFVRSRNDEHHTTNGIDLDPKMESQVNSVKSLTKSHILLKNSECSESPQYLYSSLLWVSMRPPVFGSQGMLSEYVQNHNFCATHSVVISWWNLLPLSSSDPFYPHMIDCYTGIASLHSIVSIYMVQFKKRWAWIHIMFSLWMLHFHTTAAADFTPSPYWRVRVPCFWTFTYSNLKWFRILTLLIYQKPEWKLSVLHWMWLLVTSTQMPSSMVSSHYITQLSFPHILRICRDWLWINWDSICWDGRVWHCLESNKLQESVEG